MKYIYIFDSVGVGREENCWYFAKTIMMVQHFMVKGGSSPSPMQLLSFVFPHFYGKNPG